MRLYATEDTQKIDKMYQQKEWNKIIQALSRKPLAEIDDLRLLNDLAVAYQQLQNYDKVLEVGERIRAVEPWPDLQKQQSDLTVRYMRYHAVIGEALYRKGKFDEALEIFQRLKAVGSRFSDKYYYSGRIHTKKGDYRLALLEFKGMIANIPERTRDAIRGLSDLIDASPAQAGVYQQLHQACQYKDRFDHYLSRYKKEMSASLPAALKVANLLFYEGKQDEARKALDSLRPKSEEEKGWLELIRGDWAAEAGGPEAALKHYFAAEPLLRPGDPLLVERLEELIRVHKLGPDLRKKLAQMLEAAGDADGAARHLEAAVAQAPNDADARNELGRILRAAMNEAFGAGEMEKAGRAAQRLLKVFPDDAEVSAQVEQITQMAVIGRKEKLESLLATGRMPSSEAARAHYELAGIERTMGADEETLLGHLQKAAVERSPVRAEALRDLGRLHIERGWSETAEAVFEMLFALRMGAEDRLATAYEIAELYEQKGEKAFAAKYYQQVASEDATFRDAAQRAADISRELEAAQPAGAPAAAPPAEAGPPDPMDVLSRRYDEIAELGRGAMGVVYKARDKILDRTVAIKMILGDLGNDPEALGRFISEAQSAAALEHQGIITIYDIRTEEPMFIVMEFVEGKSLADLLGGRVCPLPLFLKLAVKICEPLVFAHKAQVIHRDIKPENIMVTKNGGVKIADFGLSRKGQGSGMTQVGQVMGTPYYMAPEQIRGGEIDGRADLYALGISFYEMLTGSVPFKDGDIAYMHIHEEPPKIATRNPEVPKELEDIVMKCLAKDPADRFAGVEELLAALKPMAQAAASQG